MRDYVLSAETDDGRVELARVEGNHQRLRRHDFETVKAKRLHLEVLATNGSEEARVFEVRCYA